MDKTVISVSDRGRLKQLPAKLLQGRPVLVRGRLPRIAYVHDEEWLEWRNRESLDNLVECVRRTRLGADIFAFSEHFPNLEVRYKFPYEWDNAAAIDTKSYDGWWNSLPQETRKNVRRAEKRGVEVRRVFLDEMLVQQISRIYDESRIRQGRRFWHYGKPQEAIRRENSSYLERSEFLGAFWNGELIGFMKMVFVRGTGNLMQILALGAHQDKRPMNALIAKAVERCSNAGLSHLVYSKYDYNGKKESLLAEFKRRNGFQKFEFPYYYVPLSRIGRIATYCKLYRGIKGLVPGGLLDKLVKVRKMFLERACFATNSREMRTGDQ